MALSLVNDNVGKGFTPFPIRINLRMDGIKKRRRKRKEVSQFPLLHELSVSLSRWEIM